MKKKILIAAVVLGMFCMTGCAKMIELTDEENDMIAEYIAGFILDNEANYTEKLVTPTPVPTQKPTPSPTAVPVPSPVIPADATPVPTGKTETGEQNLQANADYSSIVGLRGIDIRYASYDTGKEYYYYNGLMSVDAEKGKKILRVTFNIVNTTKEQIDISLKDSEITYRLDLGNSKFEKAMLTAMDNDIIYLTATIGAKESMEAVLFFSVPEDMDVSGKNIIISKDDKTAIIKIVE